MKRLRKGQSILEYIIILTAIIAAIIIAAQGVIAPAVKNLMDKAAVKINQDLE